MIDSLYAPDDPFASLTREEIRMGLELLAFRQLAELEPVVDGAPDGVTVEQLAFRVLAHELFATSVAAHDLEQRLEVVEAALGVGRN
jgi:hypothetical protein